MPMNPVKVASPLLPLPMALAARTNLWLTSRSSSELGLVSFVLQVQTVQCTAMLETKPLLRDLSSLNVTGEPQAQRRKHIVFTMLLIFTR